MIFRSKVGIDFDSIKILSENAAFSIESTFDLRNRDNKDTVSTFKRIIEEGNLFGVLIVKNTEILVPQYSLLNHIENLTMIINDDLIAFKELKLISGSSNFNISGKAYDWRESILNKDAFTANLDIQSDSLNITQVLVSFSP